MSLDAVQDHTLEREIVLPSRAKALWLELRNALIAASNRRLLRTSPGAILKQVRMLDEPPPMLAEQLSTHKLREGAYCIVSGDKSYDRDRSTAHLVRDDGAWFDFTITVREHAGKLDLITYNFEICFPYAMGAPFLRFDLNIPEHRNQQRELRSHLHPGSDDIYVPSPKMHPAELIALFVSGLRRPASRVDWRTPTPVEIQWYRVAHDELAARRRA
jgi:hypothetical protein